MSGDGIAVVADAESVIALALTFLNGLPTDPEWVLVGGTAIFCRLGAMTRPTRDADTIARDQHAFTNNLDQEVTTILSTGTVEARVPRGLVRVDVMDLADDPLPHGDLKRSFALARGYALATAEDQSITITSPDGRKVLDATIPLSTGPALTALKAVSIVGRPSGQSPQKVGSDIHDLVRLVQTLGAQPIGEALANTGELGLWVATTIEKHFGSDLRYTLQRLRRFDRSPAAQALTDDQVESTTILAAVIRDLNRV